LVKELKRQTGMSHRQLLKERILALLEPSSPAGEPWHVERELEDALVRQGFDLDLVQELIDDLINDGAIDFVEDPKNGDFLISLEPVSATDEYTDPARASGQIPQPISSS
jgi:hypothetical protein